MTDRVKKIIAKSGLTQTQFADKIGIDGPKLTKSLGGKRRFSSFELAAIAEIGNESVDWILSGEERTRAFAHRAAAATIEAGDEIGREKIDLIDDHVAGLTFLGSPIKAPELPRPVRHSLKITEGKRTAQKYLDLLGHDLHRLSTHALADQIESVFGVHVVVAELPDDFDGLSYSRDDLRVIVINTSPTAPFRQRYTLAHELGHIACGHAADGVIEEKLYTSKDLRETCANAFAAELLSPRSEIDAIVGERDAADAFDDLVMQLRISPRSMAYRLFNEKLIDESTQVELAGATSKEVALRSGRSADYVEEVQQASQSRPPQLLVAAYLDAYQAGKTTLGPVATLLGVSVEDVDATYGDEARFLEPDLGDIEA